MPDTHHHRVNPTSTVLNNRNETPGSTSCKDFPYIMLGGRQTQLEVGGQSDGISEEEDEHCTGREHMGLLKCWTSFLPGPGWYLHRCLQHVIETYVYILSTFPHVY